MSRARPIPGFVPHVDGFVKSHTAMLNYGAAVLADFKSKQTGPRVSYYAGSNGQLLQVTRIVRMTPVKNAKVLQKLLADKK